MVEQNLFSLTTLKDYVTGKHKVTVLSRFLKMHFCLNTLVAHDNNMSYGSVNAVLNKKMERTQRYLKLTGSHRLAFAAAELAQSVKLKI